jgi:G:T-mismatch repair DNA endonuclease (very short patch repair protein)
MTDHLDKAQRSWNMSRIRGKNTKPEIAVRKMLHAARWIVADFKRGKYLWKKFTVLYALSN